MTTPPHERNRFLGRVTPGTIQRTPIRAEAPDIRTEDGVATLRLYDPIDSWGEFWGVSAKEFVGVLDELDDDTTEIRLHVNSPGGEVSEAIAILNALRNHPARVVAIVDGLAASAASFIVTGADEVVMGRNSELMIHDAWGICIGNAGDMLSLAGRLDQLSDNIASIYAERAGGTAAEWREAMSAETWYTAEEAVAAGLADRVEKKNGGDAEAKNRFDLSVFDYAGRGHAPAPTTARPVATAAPQDPPAEPPVVNPTPNPEGADTMSDTLNQGLRERLGVADDVELDEAGLLARLDEALDSLTEPAGNEPPAPGTIVVDEAQFNALKSAAEDGRAAREQQVAEHRDHLVKAAVDDGRIAPARRDDWLQALKDDPKSEQTLAGLPKGLVPVAAKGYTGGPSESDDADGTYKALFGAEKKGA